jgi:diguanylate cyclase (GGDEF)-like protein/PAS domain S-box-containing protein
MRLLSSLKKHILRLIGMKQMPLLLSAIVIFTGSLVTYSLWLDAKQDDYNLLRSRLEYSADVTASNILSRLNAFQVLMRGVKGYIDGSDLVTDDEFHHYIQTLQLNTHTGLKGVALVKLVSHAEKEKHIAENRKRGFTDYNIHPEGNRESYTPITSIEPLDSDNAKALGFDTSVIPAAKIAMARSRDDNEVRITTHFTLVQDDGKPQVHAFVMYLPIYKKAVPLDTVNERRAAITGWVDVPFRLNDLMAGLSGEIDPDIDIEIHDSDKLSDASRLYHSDQITHEQRRIEGSLQAIRILDIAGSHWTILSSTTPAFKARILSTDKSLFAAVTGITLTLLLALLTWSLMRSRQTADARYQKLFDQASDGVLVLNCEHHVLEANNAALKMLGYERNALFNMRMHDILTERELPRLAATVKKVMAGKTLHEECAFRRSNGEEFPVAISCEKLENDNYFLNVHDLTVRKNHEERIKQLTRLYQALSQVNQAIVRMENQNDLFPLVCQCAVNFGGMTMAWIGQLDKETSQIIPVAVYGSGVEYISNLTFSMLEDSPDGQGPTGIALRENRIVIINDYLTDSVTQYWHDRATEFGWKSLATFPIQRTGKPFAVLSVYNNLAQGFDEEATNLLREMTTDVSFGLDNFDHEAQRLHLTQDLKNAYDRIRHIMNVSPAIIYALKLQPNSENFNVDFISHNIQNLTGYPTKDWHTPDFWINHIHPDDRAAAVEAQKCLIENGSISQQYRFIHANGSIMWVDDKMMLIRDSSGNPVEAVGAWLDITDNKIAEERLRVNAQVFEFSREGIITTDADNKILTVNKAFTDITGYSAEEVIGKNPRILASGTGNKAFYKSMWQHILAKGYWQGEVLNRRKDGEFFSERLSISTVRDQDGKITQHIGIISDLSEHKLAEQRIEFLSNFDPLTQLPNRNLLSDRAKLALAAAERGKTSVALMYLDLDRFKIVNESLGLSVGDALLKELAKRLLNELRPEDTVCRQGGDEFIMLLPDTDAEGAAHVAKKLLDIVAKPFTFSEQRITLTSSIGIAEFPQDGNNFEKLTQSADAALYRAKQSGRNNFQFFTQQMHVQAYKVLQIENELRQALEQNEFELYYQPQIDTVTKEIIGAEALIRWQHPIKGLVMPSSFIPVAEESSLINDIGNWVLVSALKQLAKWQAKGIAIVPVAVNLSIVQFRQDSLYESICNALQETKLDPAMLELEMTESIAMEDSERTIRVLNQLSALGVNLSIDDFGTGYSSLSYLKRFKIDKLKIDQSFIREMENHPEDAAIIVAIIGMAKALKFKTIAEGVETEQQLAFLLQNHCDEIQGYLFSKPVPAKQFESLLRKGRISLQ